MLSIALLLLLLQPHKAGAILPTAAIDVNVNGVPPTQSIFASNPVIDDNTDSSYTLLASQASFGMYPSMDATSNPQLMPVHPPTDNPLLCDDVSSPSIGSGQDVVMLVARGTCTFERKALNAQRLGAKAIIIYGSLSSRYNYNTTTSEIVYPREYDDYDCNKWSADIPMSSLSFDPPPYNEQINDPVLSGPASASSSNLCVHGESSSAKGNGVFEQSCPSQACLLTGNVTETNGVDMMKACCAWDLHIWLYSDQSMNPSDDETEPSDPVTIPAFYITRGQAQSLFQTMQRPMSSSLTLTLYRRWYPKYNISTILIWMLGVFVASLAAYMSAQDYRDAKHRALQRLDQEDSDEGGDMSLRLEADDGSNNSEGRIHERNDGYQPVGGAGAVKASQEETLELNAYHAFGFILFSTAGLLTLFYFKVYNLVKVMYGIGCGSAMMQIIFMPLLSRIGRKCGYQDRVAFVTDVLELGPVTYLEVLSATIAYSLSIIWLVIAFTQHHPDSITFFWVMQDVMGACMCITFLATVKVNSIRIASILLVCAFFYDIFFVFVTPLLTKGGKSIMVDVATSGGPPSADPLWCEKYPDDANCQGGDPLPMLLTVPRLFDYSGGSSLLGLGDIVLPGLLLSFAARYDEAKRFIGADREGRVRHQGNMELCSNKRTYFLSVVIAYAIGLFMANVAVYVMRMGQPALLYLVPCCLGTICFLGWKRGELQDLWNTPKVILSCDEILYASPSDDSNHQGLTSEGE